MEAAPLPQHTGSDAGGLVLGFGDAVMDLIAPCVEEGVLRRLGAEAGGCVPVEQQEMQALLALPEVQHQLLRWGGRCLRSVAA